MFSLGLLAGCIQVFTADVSTTQSFPPTDVFNNETNEFYKQNLSITVIPPDIPTEAVALYLSHNVFTNVSGNIFIHLTLCESIDLSFNMIETIDRDALSGLVKLKHLVLQGNKLTSLESGVFNPSGVQISSLDLSFNELVSLPDKLFPFSLASLGLSKSNITTLSWTTFASTQSNAGTHPAELSLSLDGTIFDCGESVCWMVAALEEGWLTLDPPQCNEQPDTHWTNITFTCTDETGKELEVQFHILVIYNVELVKM